LPDLTITTLTGDSVRNEQLSDYKGKVIILDFWQTNCGSCIVAMPRMYQLQQQFRDRIKIFLVTFEAKEKVEKLWPILKKVKVNSKSLIDAGIHLPIIINDTVLKQLFPHSGNPMHIWVDGKGVYWATANEQTTTPENIEAFLAGKKVEWALDAPTTDFDSGDPLSWANIDNGKFRDKIQTYSLLLKRVNIGNRHPTPQLMIDSATKKTIGMIAVNQSILDLYRTIFAYKYPKYIGYSSGYGLLEPVIFNVRDRNKYIPISYNDPNYYFWSDSNTYCYATKVPVSQSEDLFSIIQKDFDYSFNLHSELIKKKMKLLTLKRSSRRNLLNEESEYNGTHLSNVSFGSDGSPVYHVPNIMSLRAIIRDVATTPTKPNVVVEQWITKTEYEPINFAIPWDGIPNHLSMATLTKTLKKYGLYLEVGSKMEDVMVITENKHM